MKKILALITFLAIVCSLFVGCSFNVGNTDDEANEKMRPTIMTGYRTLSHFAKVKVLEFVDGHYSKYSPDTNNLIIAKCEIVNDLLDGFAEGSVVYLVLGLSFHTNEWIEDYELKDLLSSNDYFFVGFRMNPLVNYIKEGEKDFTDEFDDESVSDEIDVFGNSFFPMKNGKIDFTALDALYFEKNEGATQPAREANSHDFTDYFRNGMTEEEVKESVGRIYAKEID